ncbi:MAG TPA: isoleucine--tRNA ligase, partial [Actinobacteria bacterium]|nr:isoleucine--tRNA ligase [Actinomycetota bacterium]
MTRYQPVDPKVDFPAMERAVIDFWRERGVFAESLRLRQDAPLWVFYEGPPTANGLPGIHHVEARTFKDVFPRYKTMTGHFVPRKAGWDCHGLPVEVEVEKEIGTKNKRDIEAFGIAEFVERCRASVTRYVSEWERLTERIGLWLDMDQAYWTMNADYVQSVWWALKQLHEQDLLFQDDKVTAYCPRCGTGLSDHEVAQGYEQDLDPSAFVRFPVLSSNVDGLDGAALVAWTTTPWTLISNLGLAVAANEAYVRLRVGDEVLVVADALRGSVAEDASTEQLGPSFPGSAMVGTRYEAPFDNVEEGTTHRVVAAAFVSMEDGTGIVHMAPAFGAEDLAVGRREGWPVFNPVDDTGRFTDLAPEYVRGVFVKDADDAILEDLRARGRLLRAERVEHPYPHCWRCKTPLLYYARPAWYVRTTARKQDLLAANETVNWFPDHIKHGRFGDWLANNIDWSLSRDRYWGTPL